MNKNVFLVQYLLGDDGKVLSYSEFFRKFQLNGNFLQYMQVVSAIPKDLMDDARRRHLDKTSIFVRKRLPALSGPFIRFT